jgi:hypothetical protein
VAEEDKDILRSVLGRMKPSGPVPAMVERDGAARLKLGADCMSCMFAIHYFFESPETLKGFVKNIADNLKVGGYFIGACFDGEKVFNLLRGLPKGGIRVGQEKDVTFWKITKEYEEDEFPEGDDAIGLPINVEFLTTGAIGREYLVHMKTLENAMKEIGCELLGPEDLKKVKLQHSTAMFDVSYDMAKKAGNSYVMSDAIKSFSFLNRWFVFQRKTQASPLETGTSGIQSLRGRVAESIGRVPAEDLTEISAAVAALEPGPGATTIVPRTAAAAPRTVAQATAAAQPVSDVPTYAVGELFQFFDSAAEKDVLAIGDKTAGQWLAPSAQFPIEDPEDDTVVYPSLEHYLAGQRFRVASNTPDVAASVFGRDGTIHQQFLRQRLLESEGGTKQVSERRDRELLKAESAAVKSRLRSAGDQCTIRVESQVMLSELRHASMNATHASSTARSDAALSRSPVHCPKAGNHDASSARGVKSRSPTLAPAAVAAAISLAVGSRPSTETRQPIWKMHDAPPTLGSLVKSSFRFPEFSKSTWNSMRAGVRQCSSLRSSMRAGSTFALAAADSGT